MSRSAANLCIGLALAALLAGVGYALLKSSVCVGVIFFAAAIWIVVAGVSGFSHYRRSPGEDADDPAPPGGALATKYTKTETDDEIVEEIESGGITTTFRRTKYEEAERADTDQVKFFDAPTEVVGWKRMCKVPRGAIVGSGPDFVVKGVEYHGRTPLVWEFAKGVNRRILLEYEPGNAADRNAIKVVGKWVDAVGEKAGHLGYLDRHAAKEIALMGRPELIAYPDLIILHDPPTKPLLRVRVFMKRLVQS